MRPQALWEAKLCASGGRCVIAYLDFDLEIGPGVGREYPVLVRSMAGQLHGTMRFPFDTLALENALLKLEKALLQSGGIRRKALTEQEQAVQDFGRALFEALLEGDLRSFFYESKRRATRQGQGLRLRMHILAPELAALPWEYLYDSHVPDYLCLSRNTPLVRYIDLTDPGEPLAITPPLQILAMIASPEDQPALDTIRERERMRKALEPLEQRGLVRLTWLAGHTWRDLQRAMRSGPWHIFHFIGHGGFDRRVDEGALALAGDDGQTYLLHATPLGRLLANHGTLRLALLNACEGAKGGLRDLFSSTAATLAQRGIPAVLAMQYEISDLAAIELTRTFYEAIADGLPVDAALAEARTAISLGVNNTLEWGTPVLYLRAQDGVLFEVTEQPTDLSALASVPSIPTIIESIETPAPTLSQGQLPSIIPSVILGAESQDQTARTGSSTVPAPNSPLGKLLHTYKGHTDKVSALAWSPNGTCIASASIDKTVQVWDIATGKPLHTYRGHAGAVHAVAWSQDSHLIASGGQDQTVQIWEAATGQPFLPPPPIASEGEVLVIAWSPRKQRLVWTRLHRRPKYWDTDNHIPPWDYVIEMPVHAIAWSPDGKNVALADTSGMVHIRGATTGHKIHTYRGNVGAISAVAWSPDGKSIACGGVDTAVQVLRIDSQQILTFSGHNNSVNAVAWSPDSKYLASGSNDQTVQVWDAMSGEHLCTYSSHHAQVLAVAWSPVGTCIASGGADQMVQVWSIG